MIEKLEGREKLKFEIGSYILVACFIYLFYKRIWISVIGGFVGIIFEEEYIKYLNKSKNKMMMIHFKDLLYSISSSMATGRHMSEALVEGEKYLKMMYREESPMLIELRHINNTIYENRGDEDEVLRAFARKTNQEDIKDFVDIYLTTRTTGGDIQKVIANTTSAIMEKMQIQREIETVVAQKQLEARIITAIPIIIILCLNVFSPDYLSPMYNTFPGRILMTVALVGYVVAFKWIVKLTEI